MDLPGLQHPDVDAVRVVATALVTGAIDNGVVLACGPVLRAGRAAIQSEWSAMNAATDLVLDRCGQNCTAPLCSRNKTLPASLQVH